MAKKPRAESASAATPSALEPAARTWPAYTVERRRTDTLLPYARNARLHSDEQVAQVIASITRFGWTMPVLVDERGEIIAGHGRVLAATRMGIDEVPVVVATGWSEEEKKAYRIADNAIPLNATWDADALHLDLQDLKLSNFDLALTGLPNVQLVSFLAGGAGDADPERAPAPAPDPITRAGELWLMGDHRLLCGDSTSRDDVARVLAGRRPNLMVTDQPFGVNYDAAWRRGAAIPGQVAPHGHAVGVVQNDDRADWREAFALFPGNIIYVWCASLHLSTVEAALKACAFVPRNLIIWNKPHFSISRGDYHWKHEPLWYAVREGQGGNFTGDRSQSTVWDIASPNPMGRGPVGPEDTFTGHSTQKPVACMQRPIVNNSRAGDDVYDPFIGSGTTVIACEITARRCLAVDIDPRYIDVAVRRWQEYTGRQAVLEGERRTFAEVAAERTRPPNLVAAN